MERRWLVLGGEGVFVVVHMNMIVDERRGKALQRSLFPTYNTVTLICVTCNKLMKPQRVQCTIDKMKGR